MHAGELLEEGVMARVVLDHVCAGEFLQQGLITLHGSRSWKLNFKNLDFRWA